MDKKEISKKYLVSALLLYFIGAAVLLVTIFVLRGVSAQPVSVGTGVILALLLPFIPLGSYTGFVLLGLKIKEIKTKYAALVVIFYPIILAFVTLFGIIMAVPKIISSLIDVIRG